MIHILIDYESIQPRHLETWADEDIHVTVFVGAHQNRLPFDLLAAMQALGARGRYVKLRHTGKNLLDFHLAFHLGELVAGDPAATYRIVQRRRIRCPDRGFAGTRPGRRAPARGATADHADRDHRSHLAS
jgi:hypothetical protein